MSTRALVCAALLGCSAARDERAATNESALGAATIELAKDWSVTAKGALVPGSSVTVRYDLARLGGCRATKYSLPAWAVAGYASFGAAPLELLLAPQLPNGPQSGVVELTLPVPAERELSLWFHGSDETGCSQWDSRFGQNFRFPIQAPDAPVIRFKSDWTTSVDGLVHAGEDVLVAYDAARVTCRSSYNGNEAWGLTLSASIDHGASSSQDLAKPVLSRRALGLGRVTLPHGSHHLEIWFENTDTYGCHAWDSRYGANYVFDY